MLLLSPSKHVSLAVFLTFLGTVSIYKIEIIHFKYYQIPLLLSVAMTFISFCLNKKNISVSIHVLLPLFVLFVAIINSLHNAVFPALTLKQMFLLYIYIYILLFFSIVSNITDDKKIINLHRLLIIAAFLSCIYEVFERIKYFSEETFFLRNRPKSLFEEQNEFGLFLVFVLGYVFSEIRSRIKIVNKILLWLTLLLIVFILISNMSRGSWIGATVVMFVVLYYQHKYKIRELTFTDSIKTFGSMICLIMFVLFLVVKLFFLSTPDITWQILLRAVTIFSEEDFGTFLIRLNASSKALEAMLSHPFTGIGFGNIGVIYGLDNISMLNFGLPQGIIVTSTNFLLDIGAETGVIGFLSVIIFLLVVFVKGTKTIHNIKDKKIQTILIGALSSYVGIIVNGLSYASHMLPFLWISAAILCVRFVFSLPKRV